MALLQIARPTVGRVEWAASAPAGRALFLKI